jgi:hypothetical protein
MDFIPSLPKTPRGYDGILLVVDKLTKMTHLMASSQGINNDAVGTARLFFDGVVRLHGIPLSIISDRDTRFRSHFWTSLWQLTGTRLRPSTAHHPQTDGQSEIMVKQLKRYLRSYLQEHRDEWDQHLTAAEIAINNSVQASTGYTPFVMPTTVREGILGSCTAETLKYTRMKKRREEGNEEGIEEGMNEKKGIDSHKALSTDIPYSQQ